MRTVLAHQWLGQAGFHRFRHSPPLHVRKS
jgi:hypothetical protein